MLLHASACPCILDWLLTAQTDGKQQRATFSVFVSYSLAILKRGRRLLILNVDVGFRTHIWIFRAKRHPLWASFSIDSLLVALAVISKFFASNSVTVLDFQSPGPSLCKVVHIFYAHYILCTYFSTYFSTYTTICLTFGGNCKIFAQILSYFWVFSVPILHQILSSGKL